MSGWPERGVVVGGLLVGVSYAVAWHVGNAPRWIVGAMVLGVALTLACTLMLGARRNGRVPPAARLAALFLFVLLVGCFGTAFALPDDRGRFVLGLPLRGAIVLFGVGLLPLAVLPLLFAHDFASRGEDEAERLIAACRAVRPPGGAA